MFLLLLNWLVAWGITWEVLRQTHIEKSFRSAFLVSAVMMGIEMVLITTGLSILERLDHDSILLAWLLIFIVSSIACYVLVGDRFKEFTNKFRKRSLPSIRKRLVRVVDVFRSSNSKRWQEKLILFIILGLIVVQVAILAEIASLSQPLDPDSIHITRIMHWFQNESVDLFQTNKLLLVSLPSFTDYAIAHIQLIDRGNSNVNFFQWILLIICGVGVSDIAGKLGANKLAQAASTLLVVSIPVFIISITADQVDIILAAWLVIFVSMSLALVQGARSWVWLFGAGGALGLAFHSSPIAVIFALPLVILFTLLMIAKYHRNSWILILIVIGIAAIINLDRVIYSRGYGFVIDGNPDIEVNEFFSANTTASNAIRNIAMHVPVFTGIPIIDNKSRSTLNWLGKIYDLTSLPATETITIAGEDSKNIFLVESSVIDPILGAPFLALLIAWSILVFAVDIFTVPQDPLERIGFRSNRSLILFYELVLIGIFLLFSSTLKWAPWNARLQLPLLVLWVPIIAVVLFSTRRIYLFIPVLIALFSISLATGHNSGLRDMHSPDLESSLAAPYLREKSHLIPIYEEITDLIAENDCSRIGLKLPASYPEYPLLVLLRAKGKDVQIRHLGAENENLVSDIVDFRLCMLISKTPDRNLEREFFVLYRGSFIIYLDPNMVREVSNLAPFDHKLITQEPEGFSTSGLKIQLGTGWYGYEGQWRWMKPISNFWVYSEDDSPVLLRLLPEIIVMEGPAFGNRGKMTISQDNKPIANLEIKTGTYAYTDLNLRPGYNLITLELAAEPFVGKRMVPGSEDERELGMLVKIVELRILDSIPK